METREPMNLFDMSNYAADISAFVQKRAGDRFTYTTEQMLKALQSHDVVTLRKASNSFFHTSGEYKRLVEYRANLMRNDFVVYPAKGCTAEARATVEKYMDSQSVRELHYQIALEVILNGVYYGYERKLGNTIYFQSLHPNFCRSNAIVNGVRSVEFDLDFFKQFRGEELLAAIAGMPNEIVAAYQARLKSSATASRWVMLDTKFARSHATPDELPPLAPVILDILNLEKYKQINLLAEELSIYKVLVQKLPLNADGDLTLLEPEIKAFHQNLRKLVKSPIDVVTTPCEIESISLDERLSTPTNRVEDAMNIVYSSAGTPMLLFNTSSGGSTALKESITVDIAAMTPILKSYETWYKQKFDSLVGKKNVNKMRIRFLPTSEHNKKDFINTMKEVATLGFPTKMMIASALELDDLGDLLDYENDELDLINRMVPPATSYTLKGDGTHAGGGAPRKDALDLTEEGAKTREGEKNDR